MRKIVALHAKIRRQRLDHAHKTALALVRDHDVIVHEALNVTGLTLRPKPRQAEDGAYAPNGAAAKTGLNKSINDAGWGIFLRVLSGKAESAGREVIAAMRPVRARRSGEPPEPSRVQVPGVRP